MHGNLKWRKLSDYALGLLFLLASMCAIDAGLVATARANPAIVTEDGPVKGFDCTNASVPGCSGSGVEEFWGIPYAAPPVGKLRWAPPQPRGRWHGVLSSMRFGGICTQKGFTGEVVGGEDCLSLNIFRPSRKNRDNKHDKLPVMVWIHGGGLVTGAGSDYDPTPLVQKGSVIVVTINYRLGFLGFFAHPALDAEGHLNADYGLMDQQFALKWVKRNIPAFGGDPNRVTIFGESAGAYSVYSQLASPLAAGLFEGAISESGAIEAFQDYFHAYLPLKVAETGGTAIAKNAGCASQTAECLRGIPAATLVKAEPSTIFPIVDGKLLPQTLDSAFASGQFNRVPVISGSNHDEYRLFVAEQYDLTGKPLKDAGYAGAVAAIFSLPQSNGFIQFLVNFAYPLTNFVPQPPGFQRAPLAFSALVTDAVFACPERNAVRSLSKYVPTYAYEFNDVKPPSFLPPISFPLGDSHFIEVQYLFDLEALGIFPKFTAAQKQLSDTMIGYWTEFAETGTPNSTGAPLWSEYSQAADQFQSLVAPTPVLKANFAADHECSSIWNTF